MTAWPAGNVRLVFGHHRDTVMDKQLQKSKRSRKSAPKSRQGCITCKTRHVKCDETRPFCKRCAKAGRKCAGYPPESEDSIPDETKTQEPSSSKAIVTANKIPPENSKSKPRPTRQTETTLVPYRNPSSVLALNSYSSEEKRFLEYFYRRTAPSISGFFDGNFYNKLLLQAGLSEPAIRYSMMAVGAMHEQFEFAVVPALEKRGARVSGQEKSTFALQQYNKAISAISRQMSSGPGSMESILMCCLLFACLECLRGDSAAAMTHIKSGAGIIKNMNKKQSNMSTAQSISATSSLESVKTSAFVEENLVPIFERLSTHVGGAAHLTSFELRDLANPNMAHEDLQEIGFRNLDDARKAIMNLGSLIGRFVRSVGMTKYEQEPTEEQVRVLAGLQRRLDLWEQSMDILLENQKYTKGLTRRAVVLQTQHKCFKVFALNGLAAEQCANDSFTSLFEEGLRLAELTLDHSESGLPAQDDEEDLHSFSLEEGVAPALFIFATRCRIPSLRRRAISTMWNGPRRQGLWNAVVMAKVAERIVELEESFQLTTEPSQPPVTTDLGLSTTDDIDRLLKANIDPALIDMPLTPESIESLQAELEADLESCDVAGAEQLLPPVDETEMLPPENARIHHVDIKESIDGSPHLHSVTFFRKPNGIAKEWEIWTENISV